VGVLSRLLVPRSVRRAAHPVRTARRAVTPKPIKKIKRSIYVATNPLGALEGAAENAVVGALRSKPRRGSKHRASSGSSSRAKPSKYETRTSTERAVHVQKPGRSPSARPSTSRIVFGWITILSALLFMIGALAGWSPLADGTSAMVCLASLVGCTRRTWSRASTDTVTRPPREVEHKTVVLHWSGDRRIEYRLGALSKTRMQSQARADAVLQQRIEEEVRPLAQDGWVLDGSFPEAVSFALDSRKTLLGRKNTYRGATVQMRREK
jgi:hypothetical protein